MNAKTNETKKQEPTSQVTWTKDGITKTSVRKDKNMAEYIKFLTNNGFTVKDIK